MTVPTDLTDRKAVLAFRQRAKRAPVQFLHEAAADEIKERLDEVNKSFTSPLLIGHITDPIAAILQDAVHTRDDERLKVESAAHDLAIHCFGLHWANDPIGQMVQSRLALKPDGLFLGVLFGGGTLHELRTALAEAETQLTGGLSPRVLPMGDLRDLGALLGRAGFALPVADSTKLTVRYSSLFQLIQDLRGMGESNALAGRHRTPPPREFLALTEEIYRQHFSDGDGYLLATFETVFLTGWAPSDNQQKPLRPGSAKTRLSDALGVVERPTGEPVAPNRR